MIDSWFYLKTTKKHSCKWIDYKSLLWTAYVCVAFFLHFSKKMIYKLFVKNMLHLIWFTFLRGFSKDALSAISFSVIWRLQAEPKLVFVAFKYITQMASTWSNWSSYLLNKRKKIFQDVQKLKTWFNLKQKLVKP